MIVKKITADFMDTNCYIVVDDFSKKAVVIDTGSAGEQIKETVKNMGVELVCILHTHGHADHIIDDFKFDVPVLIHEKDLNCLSSPDENLSAMLGMNVVVNNPSKIIKDAEKIKIGQIIIEVIHTPGHSVGSVCFKTEQCLFTGDTLFYESVGRTDFPGGSQKILTKSIINKLYSLSDDYKVYPGHGKETTIEHEKLNNPFVKI